MGDCLRRRAAPSDAVDAFTWTATDRRRAAIDHMLSLDGGPVDDWEVMKAEMLESCYGPLPE